MPQPVDTHDLMRLLEQLAEAAENAENAIKEIIREIETSGAVKVAESLSDAAIHAGMSPSRAVSSTEEYRALLIRAKRSLLLARRDIHDASGKIEGAAHIARVLPARCPNPITLGGTAVLVLTR